MKFLRAALIFAFLAPYLPAVDAVGETPPIISFDRTAQPAVPSVVLQQTRIDDQAIAARTPTRPASVKAPPNQNHRLLAPPSRQQIAAPMGTRPAASRRAPSLGMPKIESFATAGAGLAIVVGLFLVCMWLLRRSGPRPTSPLPTEAVAVLGRVPLAARNFAHLMRVGNKLVLVAITPDGVVPITEVTDPVEVQRLLGLCLRNDKQSTTAEFQNVLQQLAEEPASGFLGNEVTAPYSSQARSLRP